MPFYLWPHSRRGVAEAEFRLKGASRFHTTRFKEAMVYLSGGKCECDNY